MFDPQLDEQEDAETYQTPNKDKFEYSVKEKQRTDHKKKYGIKYSKMKTIHSQINSNLFHGDAHSEFDHKASNRDPLNSSI